MSARIAVVVFNLGGPDRQESIQPFLFNFFMDRNIIRAPYPVRYLVAKRISVRRSRKEAGQSYGVLGGRSPLLENTQAQAHALREALRGDEAAPVFETFVCMRYWHPLAAETVAQVKAWNPDRIVLLPLYPQFSTTTTRSALQDWTAQAEKAGLEAPTAMVCCYPGLAGYIEASADHIKSAYIRVLQETRDRGLPLPRLLFSAHGLPKGVIRDGDPYQWQCEQAARQIVQALAIDNLDWAVCYQSRVGPLEWIGPSTDEEIRRAGRDRVPLLVYPHAFVNEHVETLVEIEHEYRALAQETGVPAFVRVPTVSTHPAFIGDLARAVRAHARQEGIYPAGPTGGDRVCPGGFRRCCMEEGRLPARKEGRGHERSAA